uniref:Uncharacterized protein n=1 Tax=Rhabditophanes sp. KR3021 TaxID=114890 RepID=A0AC35UIN3_9BILA
MAGEENAFSQILEDIRSQLDTIANQMTEIFKKRRSNELLLKEIQRESASEKNRHLRKSADMMSVNSIDFDDDSSFFTADSNK